MSTSNLVMLEEGNSVTQSNYYMYSSHKCTQCSYKYSITSCPQAVVKIMICRNLWLLSAFVYNPRQ